MEPRYDVPAVHRKRAAIFVGHVGEADVYLPSPSHGTQVAIFVPNLRAKHNRRGRPVASIVGRTYDFFRDGLKDCGHHWFTREHYQLLCIMTTLYGGRIHETRKHH